MIKLQNGESGSVGMSLAVNVNEGNISLSSPVNVVIAALHMISIRPRFSSVNPRKFLATSGSVETVVPAIVVVMPVLCRARIKSPAVLRPT